ncbi:MAG: hypothetical protein IJU37_01535 [Desulfovibrio sp.]|nr:hypothetical protein [Desulfovibrio sp.]
MKILSYLLALVIAYAVPASADGHPLQGYREAQGKLWKKTPYTDSLGRHMVILTHTGLYQSRPGDPDFICSNGDLYAYGYDNEGSATPMLSWRMHDFVHDCETSATAEFARDSPYITDLDGNGVSEIWIIYYVGCHGDVSPDGMKILMYENGKKYALRGETFVHVDGMDMGGRYKADPAFNQAPAAFRQFADQLWRKHMRR